ncbi:hypothetical protein H9Y04_24905 [Streptomyces sp. TRM66268-LWL]|uniref:Uncharacterized protein n=1 Tax=Streptomyces polyasparticus TaxID=2767826 RepID=A0ABR7SJW9_9ACTN|nr:DUF6011 domain-containing protein [Streptomyces polyasparticus]MBC9715786.1 hypothetical protein [Streptomyces polyasparticus]
MDRQEVLPAELDGTGRRPVYCRGPLCRRELTDPQSRARGYGPECDPDTRNGHARRDIDQDPLPGL